MKESRRDLAGLALGLLAILAAWGCAVGLRHGCRAVREPAAWGAPAPVPRPVVARTVERLTVRDMEGSWVLDWGGTDWRMTLAPGGEYVCVRGSTEFVGRWWPDAFGRLCVREAVLCDGLPGAWSEWAVHWAYLRGRLDPARLSGEARYEDGRTVAVTMRRPKKGE